MTTTVVRHEARFNDDDREAFYALWEYEQQLCPDCGRPEDVCEDDTTPWYPFRRICWASAARSVATRRFMEIHKDAKPDAAGYLPTDGVAIGVALEDIHPDDDFLATPREFGLAEGQAEI